MIPVIRSEQDAFLRMAVKHFSELNPTFKPDPAWERDYFETILAKSQIFLRWIVTDALRVGFILYGIENHRFLPRKTGAIFELYVEPEFRRRGIARECALRAISDLLDLGSSKVELEVIQGNYQASALWVSLGFQRVTERYVLRRGSH